MEGEEEGRQLLVRRTSDLDEKISCEIGPTLMNTSKLKSKMQLLFMEKRADGKRYCKRLPKDLDLGNNPS